MFKWQGLLWKDLLEILINYGFERIVNILLRRWSEEFELSLGLFCEWGSLVFDGQTFDFQAQFCKQVRKHFFLPKTILLPLKFLGQTTKQVFFESDPWTLDIQNISPSLFYLAKQGQHVVELLLLLAITQRMWWILVVVEEFLEVTQTEQIGDVVRHWGWTRTWLKIRVSS